MITLFVSATTQHAGLTSVVLGLLTALDERGTRVGFLKPVSPDVHSNDRSIQMAQKLLNLSVPDPISTQHAKDLFVSNLHDRLLDDVMVMKESVRERYKPHTIDILVVEGLLPTTAEPLNNSINKAIAEALDAQILIVAGAQDKTIQDIEHDISQQLRLFDWQADDAINIIFNKVEAPPREQQLELTEVSKQSSQDIDNSPFHKVCHTDQCLQWKSNAALVGVIPWTKHISSPRLVDLKSRLVGAHFLPADRADYIHDQYAANELTGGLANPLTDSSRKSGQLEKTVKSRISRRIHNVIVAARSVEHVLSRLNPGTLVITPVDRTDIILAVSLAESRGTPLAGLILTHAASIDSLTLEQTTLLHDLQRSGETHYGSLPILLSPFDTFTTVKMISDSPPTAPLDDTERWTETLTHIANHIDISSLINSLEIPTQHRMSPAAFRHRLVTQAKKIKQKIVLPEGSEPRTIQAAIECHTKQIAHCCLLARPHEIQQVAANLKLELPDDLDIIDPDNIREQYITPMMELRKHKALSAPMAEAQLEDNVVLGTMMLAEGHVDGLVSGAIHTTANTIRPALQLIRTATGAKIVSSVFFMGLPEQVMVFGDCAVNPDPSAEELADIAIQSADSAIKMGIQPKVAMISYSTGSSGSGEDVDKVKQATDMVRTLRPDLIVDGPLQYDAASTPSVAASKAPDSLVAGKATVFIFPDLNTGNTTYKAVQRSAKIISVGPMLQGLAKPVNDLSRGASVDDIIYTIALTAIQSQKITH